MHRIHVLIAAFLVLPAAASLAGTAQSPDRIGVYADLMEECKSPEQLRRTIRHMKSTGIEFILCSAKAYQVNWDSSVAPRELVQNPTCLEKVLQCAHAEGLKVYPVFCFAIEGGESGPNILLKRNPSWAWFYEGQRRGYIDPGNPDARRYELSLISELVTKYDVDGLSLDYFRCPNRVGYTDSGRAEFLKQQHVDLAQVVGGGHESLDTEGGKKAAATNAAAARAHPIWPEWRKWRTAQLNSLAREVRVTVDKAKPGLPISSYVWGYQTYTGTSEVCQDWVSWIDQGILNWINPSGYRYTDESFLEAARLNRAHIPANFPYYITIGVTTSHGKLKNAAEVRKQMNMSCQCGADGLVFFTWNALRPFADELAPAIRAFGKN